MRIDYTYNQVVSDLRKSRNGFYSISVFNEHAERAQLDAFTEYFDGYSATQKLHDALSVFKANPPYIFTLNTSPNGLITMPDDYAHTLSGTVIVFDNSTGASKEPIIYVNEDERDTRLKSQVRPVTITSPIAVGGDKLIQLYPETPMAGEINYLRLPKTPVYAYTLIGRVITYDPTNSQDIEFNDIFMSNVLSKILAYAAQYLDDQSTQQFSQLNQKATA